MGRDWWFQRCPSRWMCMDSTMHIIRSWRAHSINITISKFSLKKFDLLLSTLEVKVFDRKEFFKSNNVLILLKDKSCSWLWFFLLLVPSPKLIHNAYQLVGLSVFAVVFGCVQWSRLVVEKILSVWIFFSKFFLLHYFLPLVFL